MGIFTDTRLRWIIAATAVMFTLSAVVEMLGSNAVSSKMFLLESLELAFLIGCAAGSALLFLRTRTRWVVVFIAVMFTLFMAAAIYEGDEPVTAKMLLLEVLELALLVAVSTLVIRCMRT
jgi:hypothetical protein